MKLIFFSKCANFYALFENAIKILENFLVLKIITFELVVGISLNSKEKTCDRLSKWKFQISTLISALTRTDVFLPNFFQSNGKLAKNGSREGFSGVWGPLTR